MVGKSDINIILSKVGLPPSLQKKSFRSDKRKRTPQNRQTDAVDEGKYRNRALERAQLKEEYKKVQEEFELLRTQTEEESRYMGGDIEFTHLVKGLDYALLEKIKKQINSDDKDSVNVTEEKELGIGFTEFGFYLYKTFFYHTNINHINFTQRLNNTIQLLQYGKKLRSIGGNVIYNFNVGNNYQFLPITTFNDSSNQTTQCDKSYITTDKELVQVFNWHMENKKRKKEDRLPYRVQTNTTVNTSNSSMGRGEGATSAATNSIVNTVGIGSTIDDEEDIYEGIGRYDGNEYNVEVLNELKGEMFTLEKEEKITYKIPEKLLKHKTQPTSKLSQHKLNELDVEIDFDDEEEIGENSKKSKKSKRGSDRWNEIEKIMKDKNVSLDKFKTTESKSQNIKFI